MIKIVLDGSVFQHEIKGDMCSIIDAADMAVKNSAMSFNSISAFPQQWNLYAKDISLPLEECEKNGDILQSIDMKEGDSLYVFRNYQAYQDPLYAAEYLKMFTKQFGERIRPATHKNQTKKKKHGSKRKNRASRANDNEVVLSSVGSLAKTIISGALSRVLEQESVKITDDAPVSDSGEVGEKPQKGGDILGQMDAIMSMLSVIGKPMLESYLQEATKEYKEDL
ncbi:hypothetical protein BgAZ_202820 [Babesia gibsoni]|uniref:Uncharacterized protein n=1 Tax=Babesia gibsoni TaxID=33632 RepID=A0AAD8LQF8_BABGI|nr:hypothetical protein BgAZ_202820 [Babesia gibsoni]